MNNTGIIEKGKALSYVYTVLLFGALWGLVEATLGLLLHAILPGSYITGFILYPIGVYFMMQGFRRHGKWHTVLMIAVVAAAIKAVDYLVPGLPNHSHLTVMRAIICEGLLTGVCLPWVMRSRATGRVLWAAVASLSWRVVWLGTSFLITFKTPGPLRSVNGALQLLLFHPVGNALIIAAFAYLPAWKMDKLEKQPAYPWLVVASLFVAVLSHFVLS